MAYEKVGVVLEAQGNLDEALKSYRDSLAIADPLAKTDPSNAGWQRDLSVAYSNVGDVLKARGELAAALKSYRDALAVRDRLAKADPGNAGWQRDLSVSYQKVGSVLVAQGDLPEALKSCRDSLEIAERLAKADPSNAGLQRNLAVSNERLGGVLAKDGKAPEAIAAFQAALYIYGGLVSRLQDPQARVNSVVPLWRLGELKGAEGLSELRQALGILKELRDASLLDARRIAWIPQVEAQIAELPFQEARAAAKAAYDAGEYAKAAAAQAKLVEAQEKAERAAAGRPGAQTATALLELSWYRLFAHDFKGSLAAADRAIAAQPDLLPAIMNKAHALMFLGRSWEARTLYARYKGQDVKGNGQWEAVALDDFKEFEKRGLKIPQIAEIKALLAPK